EQQPIERVDANAEVWNTAATRGVLAFEGGLRAIAALARWGRWLGIRGRGRLGIRGRGRLGVGGGRLGGLGRRCGLGCWRGCGLQRLRLRRWGGGGNRLGARTRIGGNGLTNGRHGPPTEPHPDQDRSTKQGATISARPSDRLALFGALGEP